MNIYVGNIPWDLTDEELKKAFEAHGQVSTAKIIMDKFTGKSRGFGFVEMPEKSEAETAISSLNGKDLKGREIVVNEARPRKESSRGGRKNNYSSRGKSSKW
jgi:RNA recognition motif-containing protein